MSKNKINIFQKIKDYYSEAGVAGFIIPPIVILGIPAALIYAYLKGSEQLQSFAIIGLTICSFIIFYFLFFGLTELLSLIFFRDEKKRDDFSNDCLGCGCLPIILLTLCVPFSLQRYLDEGTFAPDIIDHFINNISSSSGKKNTFYDDGSYNYNLDDSYLDDNTTVWTTNSGKCYHLNHDCVSLKRSSNIYSTTKEDARDDGLIPCHICTAK